jgi:hypothetical protein
LTKAKANNFKIVLRKEQKSSVLSNLVFELVFNPWSKFIFSILFSGFLYWISQPIKNDIFIEDLIFNEVHLTNEVESGSSRDNIKIYFKAKGYLNKFGITSGGTYSNWTNIEQALTQSTKSKIGFLKTDQYKLNNEKETIKIYHFETNEKGLLFDIESFKKREENKSNRVRNIFMLLSVFIILASFYKAITSKGEHRNI